MRVLHVIQRYWPCVGGAERYLQEVSERLVDEGHEVTVYTTNAWDLEYFWNAEKAALPTGEEVHRGVRICRFPVRHLPGSRVFYPAIRRLLTLLSALPLNVTPLLFRLAGLTPRVPALATRLQGCEDEFDVVGAMTICFEALIYPALRFARRSRVPFVLYPLVHLGEGEGSDLRRHYTMQHQMELARRSDRVFAQTQMEMEFLASKGVVREGITKVGAGVVPNDVLGGDAQRFRQRHSLVGPIVFSLGTVAFDKGSVHTVEAMRALWAKRRQCNLVMAGPVMDQFQAYYDRLPQDIRKKCLLVGPIAEGEKKDLLAAGDIFVMPSRTESLGIVYLEAWLCGKPVIGARAGGVSEVIADGENGFLVPFGDVEALAHRIDALLARNDLAERFGARGRQKVVESHLWDEVYEKVRSVYLELDHLQGPELTEDANSASSSPVRPS
jgi:glycogen(starch) synthase